MPNLPSFPYIAGGTTNLYPGQYPLSRSQDYQTIISEFQNGGEQRFQDRSLRGSFILQYTAIPQSDRLNLDAFILAVGGSSGQWFFSLPDPPALGRPYGACQFDDETFTWQENKAFPLHYNGSIRFRVTTQQSLADAVPNANNLPGTNFPTVAAGMRTGYPFLRSTNFQVARVDLPTGNRVAYPLYGSGFPGYPTRPLYSWTLTFNAITDADLITLEAHYLAMSGRYTIFGFIDPTEGAYYSRVRYDMDSFKIVHLMVGLNAVTIKLAESFGPGWVGPVVIPLFGTGIVTPGVLATLGSPDGHYSQSGPAGNNCFVANMFPWNWLPNNSLSQWIAPAATGVFPAGNYTYTTTFNLGVRSPYGAILSGHWACDDIANMYLNGNQISQTGGFAASKLSHFSTTTGFVSGINTLTLIVGNTVDNTPTGVRCAARCIAY